MKKATFALAVLAASTTAAWAQSSVTLYGIVDRTSWFNDDYVKKYGDLVAPANKSLVGATNLCSKECSQGRSLTDFEMDAVLTYLWTLGLRWGDLPEDGIPLAMAETVAQRGDDEGRINREDAAPRGIRRTRRERDRSRQLAALAGGDAARRRPRVESGYVREPPRRIAIVVRSPSPAS